MGCAGHKVLEGSDRHGGCVIYVYTHYGDTPRDALSSGLVTDAAHYSELELVVCCEKKLTRENYFIGLKICFVLCILYLVIFFSV